LFLILVIQPSTSRYAAAVARRVEAIGEPEIYEPAPHRLAGVSGMQISSPLSSFPEYAYCRNHNSIVTPETKTLRSDVRMDGEITMVVGNVSLLAHYPRTYPVIS
jgi:hypothetical protein